MSAQQNRRFVFIDFENLQKVKFKKLEKVCTKIFILINAEEKNIPFKLVRQIQKFGKDAKWVGVDKPAQNGLNFQLCYLMGILDQKVPKEIDFAIVSNDRSFAPVIKTMQKSGRKCMRLQVLKTNPKSIRPDAVNKGNITDNNTNSFLTDSSIDTQLLNDIASETINRLIRSGKRPGEVEMLRNYILLHNQEFTKHGKADKVIEQLERDNKITIHKGAVIYNF